MEKEFRSQILSIYDTIADPGLWPSVLDRIGAELNAFGCIVFEWTGQDKKRDLKARFFSSRFELPKLERYLRECSVEEGEDQDVFERHSLKADPIDLIDDDVLTPTPSDLRKRRNVAILEKFGIRHRAAGLLDKSNTAISRFSVQLPLDCRRLTPRDRDYLAHVLPHVAKALDLGRPALTLTHTHRSLLAAMDKLSVGICILDRLGRVVTTNVEFRRQQDDEDSFQIDPSGILRMQSPEDEARFAALKSDVVQHGKFGARPRKEAVLRGQYGAICLEIAPLDRLDEMGSNRLEGFIVTTVDASLPLQCDPRPMRRAFGLTKTELAILHLISEGLTNREIAQTRERSLQTVNNQVKSILSKTYCANRTQLVRLMTRYSHSFLTE